MCGIAGIVGDPDIATRDMAVAKMVTALQRRGPDGHGQHAWGEATFGHRRLAIFDLSDRGAQPMLSADGVVGITFNGAIYNFKALRDELRAAGCAFMSDTDTEVLLHGYRAWGIQRLVGRLQGMFAFAIWDDSIHELFLVRDRLGVKPLTFAMVGQRLAFASTARALRWGGFGGDVDPQSIADFLEWGVVSEQRSVYSLVSKLPPATIGHWRAGALSLSRYWSTPDEPAREAAGRPFGEIVEQAEELLLAAVRRRTDADVPIGALLSGGVDSALICWALRECGAAPEAFTFGAPGEPEDETPEARQTARELGIPLTVLPPGTLDDDWEALTNAYAEPFACASALGMLRLSQAAKERVTVLITGDGGDDMFLGYPHHRFLYTAERVARMVPSPVAKLALELGLVPPGRGPALRAQHFASYVAGGLGAFLRARNGLRYYAVKGLLGPRLSGLSPSSHSIKPRGGSGRTVLTDYLPFAQDHQFVAEYLAKVDGATMHYGLEARSPFLDHDLWEFAARLPYSQRLRGGQLKAVLRAIASRRISGRVATGRKRGFEVPVGAWLQGRWADRTRDLLQNPLIVAEGWVDGSRLSTALEREELDGPHLWNFVVLEHWLRHERAVDVRAAAS